MVKRHLKFEVIVICKQIKACPHIIDLISILWCGYYDIFIKIPVDAHELIITVVACLLGIGRNSGGNSVSGLWNDIKKCKS